VSFVRKKPWREWEYDRRESSKIWERIKAKEIECKGSETRGGGQCNQDPAVTGLVILEKNLGGLGKLAREVGAGTTYFLENSHAG